MSKSFYVTSNVAKYGKFVQRIRVAVDVLTALDPKDFIGLIKIIAVGFRLNKGQLAIYGVVNVAVTAVQGIIPAKSAKSTDSSKMTRRFDDDTD